MARNTALFAAAGTAASHLTVLGANDRIRVGVMGIRGRGGYLSRKFAERDDVEVAFLCDVNSTLFQSRAKQLAGLQKAKPKTTQDYRTMLADKSIDAVINATPDHWHALGTIAACRAEKDVYTEKPACHNIWEGEKMVEAARKYKRVVQLGTQTRSAPYAIDGIKYLRSGRLGKIHYVRILNMKTRGQLSEKPDGPPPKGVDYDMWLGPAPKRPFNPNHFYGGTWNWKWAYSGGDIINDGIHQIDLARWIINRRYPKAVYANGGIYHLKDKQDTPDTQIVTFEYDDALTMTCEVTLWTPYIHKTSHAIRGSDTFPDWPRNATKVEVYGTDGMMIFGRHGGGWQVWGRDAEPVESRYGRPPTPHHIQNFISCMWSRKRPNADIEEGHLSTLLPHLANISYRVGGRRLHYDSETKRFLNCAEADKLIKRTYREPYVIPEEV